MELTVNVEGTTYKKIKQESLDCNGCAFYTGDRCDLLVDNEYVCVEHDNFGRAVFYILQNIDIES